MASRDERTLSVKAAFSSKRNTAVPPGPPSKAPTGRLLSADQCLTPSRQGMSGVPLAAIIPLQSNPSRQFPPYLQDNGISFVFNIISA